MLFKQIATLAMCLLGAVKAYQEADAYTFINHPSTNRISNHQNTPLRKQAVNLLANLGQDTLLALLSLFGAAAAVGLSGVQNSNINQVSRRVSENDGNIATLQTKAASTCAKLSELLAISDPQSIGGLTAPTPSNNPVSDSLGDRTAGASPGYPILFPIGTSPTTPTLIPGVTDGLAFPTRTTTSIMGTLPSNTALSIADFNIFRGNVIQAVDILDQKIRDILAVAQPTCP